MAEDGRKGRESLRGHVAGAAECEAVLKAMGPRFEYFDQFISRWRDLEVLVVECGAGCTTELLVDRGCRVSGVDGAGDSVTRAAERAVAEGLDIDYRVGAPEHLPFDDGRFDVVLCVEVLEHTSDLRKALAEMARVLRPGGYFLFDSINRTWTSRVVMIWLKDLLLRKSGRRNRDWRRFIKPAELRRALEREGFMNVSIAGLSSKQELAESATDPDAGLDDNLAPMGYVGIGRTAPGPPVV